MYEYDTQGRLTRVLAQETPRVPLQLVATCTYGSSTITELITTYYGFRQKTLAYTLDTAGNLIQLKSTVKGDENNTNITTFTYLKGKILRAEHREASKLFPLTITVMEYNDSGLLIKEEKASYDKNNKIEYKSTHTYNYEVDKFNNWTTRRTYIQFNGNAAELDATDTRVIIYIKS